MEHHTPPGARLKIHCPDLVPLGRTCIELNGQDITRACRSIAIVFDVDGLTTATLKILVKDLEVTAETMVLLEAHVKKAVV